MSLDIAGLNDYTGINIEDSFDKSVLYLQSNNIEYNYCKSIDIFNIEYFGYLTIYDNRRL